MAPADSVLNSQRVRRGSNSFNWLLASIFASSIGRNGYNIACAWLLAVSGQGAIAVTVFFAIVSATELVASPVAGWMSDRYNRRLLCLIVDALRFLAALALGGVFVTSDVVWAVWISAILYATCDRFALTASLSMIPSITATCNRVRANSLVFFFMQSGSLAAAVATGIMLHTLTSEITFLILALTFMLSCGCMLCVQRKCFTCDDLPVCKEPAIRFDARLLHLCAVYSLLYTGGMLVSVAGPSFVFEELLGTAMDFGHLEAAWSAGSIIGAIALVPLVYVARIPVLQFAILALTAIAFVSLKMPGLPWVLLIFAVLGGLYNLGRVAVEVELQSSVAGTSLGRAKAVLHSTAVLLGLILFGVVSIISDLVAPSTIFLIFGLIVTVGTIAIAGFGYIYTAGNKLSDRSL